MEIKITTKQLLNVLYVIAWIIFIGLCIEAGGIIFNTCYIMFVNESTSNSWLGSELSGLYQNDTAHFITVISCICIVAVMKALLFYLIVVILHDKKLNMVQPFNSSVGRFIFNLSYLSLGIGLFSLGGVRYLEGLEIEGKEMSNIAQLHLGGGDVWLFMGVVLLVIAQIFKRGIEIQEEHELTV
ncbi:DUF2975 domain-containing protein [Pedobacter polaris]|uniref:DUF2975 domain-containing protein n=1 Tax=Pedobacter polaris TaxID=2571273 RepID=A0A4U1CU69_9SPHI|nr:DUF2975 domain-containing protein [Pedobacter polaris]TKC12771.1 DUF2975 domain-containing protein [Pedobacter polaris]